MSIGEDNRKKESKISSILPIKVVTEANEVIKTDSVLRRIEVII